MFELACTPRRVKLKLLECERNASEEVKKKNGHTVVYISVREVFVIIHVE